VIACSGSNLARVPDAPTTDPVLETMALGFQWPTIDPFLFCVHHDDAYPAGNEHLGPAASLEGRQLGQDFAGIDGWRMYHGDVVPGFPQHPHRGFETVTYVRQGLIDHSDSLGAAARFGRGDVQWLTAGGGIVHSEMFPLLDREQPNPVELFQIWLNLPSDDKLVDPHFTMLWEHDIPTLVHVDDAGHTTEVTVIAGELEGLVPPPPPPSSWASRPEADVAIWHLRLEAGARWMLPPTKRPETVRTLYGFEGAGFSIGGREIDAATGAVVRCDTPVELASPGGCEVLVLQGRPIGEPVAQYGPFVMNAREEIVQAIEDYQRTGFGGWAWAADGPVHDRAEGRFARHGDGHLERVPDDEAQPERRMRD
jgi:redox-sensitive bicupin YhaK (pirin superfamily)